MAGPGWIQRWVWSAHLSSRTGQFGLLRSSGAVLLDAALDTRLTAQIRERLEVGTDRVADLHVWGVGPGHAAVIAALVTDHPVEIDRYKARLRNLTGLSHITIEVHACPDLHQDDRSRGW